MPVVPRFVLGQGIVGEKMNTQTPIVVEVVSCLPTTFVQCWGCEAAYGVGNMTNTLHNEQLNAFPEEWKQEAADLVKWTEQLRRRFGRRVRVRLVDAMSFQGFWLTLRYRVRRYPFFIIGGRVKQVGFDAERINTAIAAGLASV